jgi:hypothetical protein
LTVNGVKAQWFRISANGKTGYLWSGFLTTVAMTSDVESSKDVIFLAGISAFNEKDYRLTMQVRAAKNGKEIAKMEFPSVGDFGYQVSLKLIGPIFDNVKQVLSVEMVYGACDYAQGDNLIVFTEGSKLVRLMETTSSSSAGAGYASQDYILPSDKGGIAGHVIVTEDSAEEAEVTKNGQSEYKIKNQKLKITLHKWTGSKLEKVFSR